MVSSERTIESKEQNERVDSISSMYPSFSRESVSPSPFLRTTRLGASLYIRSTNSGNVTSSLHL
ncbi:hypothetical protein Mapa_007248 [Marchantia paleacea]|nr:hypothetical protein Mapa_007248 [Marchantia paleacea]